MRTLLFLLLSLFTLTTWAQDTAPPQGKRVFDVLLGMGDLRLEDEPLCTANPATVGGGDANLDDHLASALASSFRADSQTTITANCSDSGGDQGATGSWECKVEIFRLNSDGGLESSSMIAFDLTGDGLEFVPGSLRCF